MRYWNDIHNQPAELPVNNSLLAAKNPWLQQQFSTPLVLGERPFVVGRRPAAGEGLPPWQPDLELNDTAPFRLSRNHFTIEKGEGGYRVRDLCSTLGTIVNGERIGNHLGGDGSTAWEQLPSDALLRAGENEVIAGGPDSPFVFSVFITSRSGNDLAGRRFSHLGRVDGLRAGKGIGRTTAARPAARLAVERLFMVLALSVLLGGCGHAVGQDAQAYNTCLSRHPHDTVVCEGPRQAYELDPSVVQLRSVASRSATGRGY
jgi:hypothetical protein